MVVKLQQLANRSSRKTPRLNIDPPASPDSPRHPAALMHHVLRRAHALLLPLRPKHLRIPLTRAMATGARTYGVRSLPAAARLNLKG
jgi:hypothetical protein